MDDCGHCPRCGGELRISPRAKILYECINYECDYKKYLWPNPPKGGKAKGGKKMDAREKWEFLVDCYNIKIMLIDFQQHFSVLFLLLS